MQKPFHVYLIKNNLNQKVYIGKTSGSYRNRWHKHVKIAEGNGSYSKYTKYPIHLAIAKYGVDNFSFLVLQSFDNEDDAYSAEIDYIKKFNSIQTGYNIAIGGKSGGSGEDSNVAIFSNSDIHNIFQEFVAGLRGAEIARKHNCTKTTIYDIIDRITYCAVKIDDTIISKVKMIRLSQKKTPPGQLNTQNIVDDYLDGLSYRELATKYNSSTFTIQKVLISNVDQSIIDKNKMCSVNKKLGDSIINEYLTTDLTAHELGAKYNKSKYAVYDILRGRTFDIDNKLLEKIKQVKRAKSARKWR